MKLRPSEAGALIHALEDYDIKNALRVFCAEQVKFYADKVLSSVRKPEPNMLEVNQNAGRLDAYETLIAELEHFAHNSVE